MRQQPPSMSQYFSSFWRFDLLGYDLSCVMRELYISQHPAPAGGKGPSTTVRDRSTPNMAMVMDHAYSYSYIIVCSVYIYIYIYIHINIYICVWRRTLDIYNRGLPLGTRQQHVAPMIAENMLREPLQHNHASVLSVSTF
jgi:hypothetical protein